MGSIKIDGDNNQVYNNVKNSKINSENTIGSETSEHKLGTCIGLIIAALSLIATCIIGWNEIVAFFII